MRTDESKSVVGRTMLVLTMVIAIGWMSRPSFAQERPKVPILEENSYLLLKVDLSKLDLPGLSKWVLDRIGESKLTPAERTDFTDKFTRGMEQMTQVVRDLNAAGAPVIYLGFCEFPPDNPTFFIPTGPASKQDAIAALMNSGRSTGRKPPALAQANDQQMVVEPLPGGLFFGRAMDYRRLQNNPVGAPQLLFALSLAAAGNGQAVVSPSEDLKTRLETSSPQIPDPVNMPMTTLTQGISFIAASVQSSPGLSAQIVVQAQDAAKAAEVKKVIDKYLQFMSGPTLAKAIPNVDWKAAAAILAPQLKDDQVLITIDEPQARMLVSGMALPALARSRTTATMVASAGRIKQMLRGIIMYAQDHNGALPDSLDQLTKYGIQGQMLINPRGGAASPDFIYRKPAAKLTDLRKAPETILVIENPDDLPADVQAINVGYADGHVEARPAAQVRQELKMQGIPTKQP